MPVIAHESESAATTASMKGIRVFSSVEEAQAAGFTIFDHIPEGYLVRKDLGANFALAVVKIKKEEPTEKN